MPKSRLVNDTILALDNAVQPLNTGVKSVFGPCAATRSTLGLFALWRVPAVSTPNHISPVISLCILMIIFLSYKDESKKIIIFIP